MLLGVSKRNVACGQQAVMICYVMTCSARTLTAKIRKHNTEKYLFFEEINTWETGFKYL